MKYLCLAYGDEAGWKALSENEKAEVLAVDEKIRRRGDFMTAVKPNVVTIRNWNKDFSKTDLPLHPGGLPLAGFSIIEADSVEEVIELVSNSPCARAQGAIEIREFWDFASSD